jgi:hypothetical protein
MIPSARFIIERSKGDPGRNFAKILALHCWFSLETEHEFTSLPAGQQVPEREQHPVQPEQLILIMVWNPNGFHLIYILPKRSNLAAVIQLLISLFHCSNGAKLRSLETIEN